MARLAEVSVGTVSKALNNNGSLRAGNARAGDRGARAKLGFRPNDLAQSLHRGQTFTVGLISTDSFGRFTIPIMEGLEECLADSRIAVFMCNATDDPEREAQHVESLLAKRVDGIVVTARRADRRSRLRVPAPACRCSMSSRRATTPTPSASCPTTRAAPCSPSTILPGSAGSGSPTSPGPSGSRRCGSAATATARRSQRHGLAEPDGFYLPGVWSEGWGREAVAQLFRGRVPPPDAIFCGNDQIARGVCDALRERGIVVPDTVSVVGFDNWEIIAEATRPPLTTRRHEPRRARPRGRQPASSG